MATETRSEGIGSDQETPDRHAVASKGVLATAGLVGAVLAASCCIAPFTLVMIGISGAWISNLTALAPYQPLFLIATGGFLGTAYWKVYRKTDTACEEGSYCANPRSDRAIKIALWVATILVVIAMGIDFLGPLFL